MAELAERSARRGICGTALFLAATETAAAHAGEGAEILLLPTELYIVGGALAVLASFAVLALYQRKRPVPDDADRGPARTVPSAMVQGLSLASLLLLGLLVTAGIIGKPDPLSNPLPMTVWTLWWMGFTLVVVIAGNLWTLVNPWIGLYGLVRWQAPLRYPEAWGYLPAILLFFGFAWFELVYATPLDPTRLAGAVMLYWLVNLAALMLFGPRWLQRGEALSVFFAMAGSFSLLHWRMLVAEQRAPVVSLAFGRRGRSPRDDFSSPTGTIFVLLTLSSVSFDGLSRTFAWAGWLGINPLEFPGRSAVLWQNSAGLVLSVLALGGMYAAAIALGPCRTGLVAGLWRAMGLFVITLAPISIAYHLAHYLPSLIVGFPSAILALADPFGLGWSVLPGGLVHKGSGMGLGHDAVVLIYRVQTAIIVAGHILATLMAHRIALAQAGSRGEAVKSQVPLATLMVLYTLFGLWLLSTPQIG